MGGKSSLVGVDAPELLARDHRAIERLFLDFERLTRRRGAGDRRVEIVCQICSRLSLHLQIQEEIFFAAARTVLGQLRGGAQALSDHRGARQFIARSDEMDADTNDFSPTVALRCGCVVPPINDEPDEVLPALRAAGMDLAAGGRPLAQRTRSPQQDAAGIGLRSANPNDDSARPLAGRHGRSRAWPTPAGQAQS